MINSESLEHKQRKGLCGGVEHIRRDNAHTSIQRRVGLGWPLDHVCASCVVCLNKTAKWVCSAQIDINQVWLPRKSGVCAQVGICDNPLANTAVWVACVLKCLLRKRLTFTTAKPPVCCRYICVCSSHLWSDGRGGYASRFTIIYKLVHLRDAVCPTQRSSRPNQFM